MGVMGKAHGDTLAKQEEFSSGGFGSTATSPSLFAASSSNSVNQSSIGLTATGPSAFPPPLFGVASSSNISNPTNFGLAVTGPSTSPPPFFGAAASSNISNQANFGFAASGPSAFHPPLFAAASSSNISNPANFGFAAAPSLSRSSLFAASCSGNNSTQALSWPAFLPPCASSFNVSPSLFAGENHTATSASPVFCSSSSTMTSLPKQSHFAPSSTYNATTGSSPPVFGCGLIANSSSGSSWVAPSSSPSSSIFTTTATATVLPPEGSWNKQEFSFGGFGSPANPSTFCASSSSINSTQAMSSGFLPFTNSGNAFSSSSSQINPPAFGFSSLKPKSSPTEAPFASPPTSTMASPPVSKFGFWPPINSSNAPPPIFDFSCTPLHCFANIPSPSQKDSRPTQPFSSIFPTATTTTIFPARGEEVRKPASHLCPSCGQTLLSGNVYSPTLSFDQYRPWWLQSISAMMENQAKSHEELKWANHLLHGNAKDNVAPVAQSTILNQPQWTLPVMVLPVMPFPTWGTLPYIPASASTLPAFSANGAAFGYASSSFSGTPMMPAVFNLSDMFRCL